MMIMIKRALFSSELCGLLLLIIFVVCEGGEKSEVRRKQQEIVSTLKNEEEINIGGVSLSFSLFRVCVCVWYYNYMLDPNLSLACIPEVRRCRQTDSPPPTTAPFLALE